MPNKYRAKKVKTSDGTFASQAEYRRWCELKLMERAGEIKGLKRQGKYWLHVKGDVIGYYRDDFNYFDNDGHLIVEDVKGVKTPVYRLKKKLMRAIHGIEITEVAA